MIRAVNGEPSPRFRRLWVMLGFFLLIPGVIGVILPGLPGTVFFVAAAGAFAKGDPRLEAWLLSRPVIGPMIHDYRRGRGMPLRAKWIACLCILTATVFSVLRIPVLIGQVSCVLLSLIGVWYITLRVPTKLD